MQERFEIRSFLVQLISTISWAYVTRQQQPSNYPHFPVPHSGLSNTSSCSSMHSIIRTVLSFLWMSVMSEIWCSKLYPSNRHFKRNTDDTCLSSCSSVFTEYRTGWLFTGLPHIAWDKHSSQLFWWGFYWSVKSTHDLLLCNHFTETILSKNKLKLTQDMEKSITLVRATAANTCIFKLLSHILSYSLCIETNNTEIQYYNSSYWKILRFSSDILYIV